MEPPPDYSDKLGRTADHLSRIIYSLQYKVIMDARLIMNETLPVSAISQCTRENFEDLINFISILKLLTLHFKQYKI